MKLVKYIILLAIIYSEVYPQVTGIYTGKIHEFGLNLSYSYNAHKADFNQLPNVPNCCPHFESGNGNGFSIALLYEYTFINRLSSGIRLGVESLYGKLTATESESILIDERPESAIIGHTLEGKLYNLFVTPYLNYQIVYGANIYGGISLGYLIGKKYEQLETLIVPENYGTFENGLRYRNNKTGNITGNNIFLLFFTGGISYDFPLESSNSYLVSPEISFTYQLNSFLKESLWKTTVIKFGITLKYSPGTSLASPIKPQNK